MSRPPKGQRQPPRSWPRGPYRQTKAAAVAKTAAALAQSDPSEAGPAPRVNLAGLAPRARLDAIHAAQAMLDYRQRRGELVERAQVEAGHAEMREVIRSDLLGTLPLRLGGELAGRALPEPEVREIVLRAVRAILLTWHHAGIPVPEGK